MSGSSSLHKTLSLVLGASTFAVALFVGSSALAQQEPPAAPTPAAAGPATLTFPTPDPKNFTADKPTPDEVNAFLKATWGYDPNLAWQTMAIAKTAVAGVSKITVAIGQKSNPSQVGQLVF